MNSNDRLLTEILFSYVEKKRLELKLDVKYSALVIFDQFQGQCTDIILALLEAKHVLVTVIPGNCTD